MHSRMKEMIVQTLNRLLEKKSIDKITVTDIVNECGIARQTFYYHFQDILDVMAWEAQQEMQRALERSLLAATPEEAIRELVLVSVEKYPVIEKLLASQYREFFEQTLTQTVQSYLKELILRRPENAPARFADADMALCFYAGGIVSVLRRYAGKKHVDVDRLSKQLCDLLLGRYFN